MKVTDYSKIADKYDKNKYRQNVNQDLYLKEFIKKCAKDEYNILDLACGTGIYLSNQMSYFPNDNINWHGLDASKEMLSIAKEKVKNVDFVNELAENMSYESNRFDYIVNNYAFQHFTKKTQALDEIYRVLNRDGIFKMHNISVYDMKNWWIYQYFPNAYDEDIKRFWTKELIYNELANRNFDVNLEIKYNIKTEKLSNLLDYVENKDISILTLLRDSDYKSGLEKMRYEINNNPNTTIVCDFAEMFCIAKKL
ncbi:class I SAM-dependent methyltransferase [Clostridium sp. BL-8]|uniref:class I SAM-dependent methyltransferase n=1 Tax=Clostridium sp. BL-8 TaxID=349938 RepID=UPI00098C1F7A|nr:class I SAM-dependent methyltransferase [Clostridium sp. BL-8]OOM70898.1 putative methyltransferase YcgJ [Clostridium sp. BL-8]